MARFRKKPVKPEEVEATQWFKNGDHPDDQCEMIRPDPKGETQFKPHLSEGAVVKHFRESDDGYEGKYCAYCGKRMEKHGSLETEEGWDTVCPGYWIITEANGERNTLTQTFFEMTYEPIED